MISVKVNEKNMISEIIIFQLSEIFLDINYFNLFGILWSSHDQLYKHICMQNHNNDAIKTRDTVL